MRRPSFQFYPADWRNNANLRRCSWAARGVWIEVMGLLHDSDQYGALRWTLKEIAQALGCQVSLIKELAVKGVMKGCDSGLCDQLIYVPRSGRKDGQPVMLIESQSGPIWYSSRMVKDEYIREVRGEGTRFNGDNNDIPKQTPKPPIGEALKTAPKAAESDGSTSTSTPTGKRSSIHRESTTTNVVTGNVGSMLLLDFEARCKTVAERLTGLEAKRGIEFKFSPLEGRLVGWVKAGVTDPQLREAYDMALTQRIKDGSPAAINYGFMDTFVRKVMQDDGVAVVPIAVKEWHESASGIEAKAAELGLTRRFDEPFPTFKARVFEAAGLEVEAA